MIYKISGRERQLIFAAAGVIAAYILVSFVLRPALTESRKLDQEIQLKKRMIQNDLFLLNQKEDIEAESRRLSKYEGRGASSEEEATSFLKRIEEISKKSSVFLADIKPYTSKKIGYYTEYRVEIEIEGSIDQVITFCYNLQGSEELLRTVKCRIIPKEGSPSLVRGYLTVTKVST